MDEAPLTSLSLTHVNYRAGDPISLISAWLALVPQASCVMYVTLIWATRETEILLMFAGQMGNELINFVLKRYIREERPQKLYGRGYGMPSSHAQFVAFFSVSLSLFLLVRHSPLSGSTAWSASLPNRLVLAFASIAGAAAVASSRYYLNYHTPKQIYVGVAAGVVCALGWFAVVSYARQSGLIDWALELPLARWTRMRDLLGNEDIADAGWTRWEAIRRERQQSTLTKKDAQARVVKASKKAKQHSL